MISNIYAQCDDYNEFNCSNEDSCEWIDIPVETGSCSALSLSVCDLPEYGPCYSYCTNWGYYYNCTGETICIGGLYEIDNSYCQEIEMPECSAMNELECSGDNSCEWVEDIETGNCGNLWGDDCELNAECNWNCDSIDDYMGWCTYSCDGGPYEIDNSYCQEIEMPECSEMSQSECSSNGSCDWVEDIDWGSCADLDPIWNVVYYCDDPSTNLDNCYTYTCYGGGYGQWGTCCGGDPYIISDNSYCEEVQMPECSEMSQSQCINDDSCNWIEDYEWSTCSNYNSAMECSWANDNGGNCDWSWNSTQWQDTCSGGPFQLDTSYCEESSVPEYQLGDVNQDSTINIQDVIMIVNLVLNNNYNYLADMNDDHRIDVLDIIELVNRILN